MPHVKLKGELDIKELWRNPPNLSISDGDDGMRINFSGSYLSNSLDALVLRFVIAEGRLVQHVQLLIVNTREGWLVKLDSSYPLLRTPGVKILVATVSEWLVLKGLQKTATTVEPFERDGHFHALHSITQLAR